MREYELEVLEQYHIEVKGTRKIRGAFFIDTNEGTMLLKETGLSDRRAPLLYIILSHLESVGFGPVDTPVFTAEGKLVGTSREGKRYLLKKWYSGRECDVRREGDVLETAGNLARLHQKLCWQPVCGIEEKEELKPQKGRNLQDEFDCHNRELKKIRAFVRGRSSKDRFDYLFLSHFEPMYRQAAQVTDRLRESGYEGLYRESMEGSRLIHGDYNYHNVLMLPAAEVATTNFEHFRMDIPVQDLCYFLRKVMEKHHWDAALGDAMLNSYGKICPLRQAELEYMALKLAYPEKFWKTMNSYYHSNKVWVPEKNVEKLMVSVTQSDEKMNFLEKIFSFHL